jgi:hypothetical protein
MERSLDSFLAQERKTPEDCCGLLAFAIVRQLETDVAICGHFPCDM